MRCRAAWGSALLLLFTGCGILGMRTLAEQVPVYPGAQRMYAVTSGPPDGTPAYTIVYRAPAEASPETIASWYEEQMPQHEWIPAGGERPAAANVPVLLRFVRDRFWCDIAVTGLETPYTIRVRVGRSE